MSETCSDAAIRERDATVRQDATDREDARIV